MKRLFIGASAIALAATQMFVGGASAGDTSAATTSTPQEFVVLYAAGVSADVAHAAIAVAGGTIVGENAAVGVATVSTTNASFSEAAAASAALAGTARNRVIGGSPDSSRPSAAQIRKSVETGLRREGAGSGSSSHHEDEGEPLAALQWDMQQIDATAEGSYDEQPGAKGVTVGIIDTGVDGSHPDIAPNFNAPLSRNFTVDIPFDANGAEIDGPCEDEPDMSCNDPADVDEDGHGTHVASTIASPINGLGIAGVAPNVTIVNLRAGQDSGYFFLQPSVDALTYAGDHGIDVVNMSYYVDPWLFNCAAHPADSPADQAEQRTIVEAMQRALDYARAHGVTLISAAGNEGSDYDNLITDESSPDFADTPGEIAYVRELIDPHECTSMPSQGKGVITVGSTGPSTRKAYYSNYGNTFIDVAAPGGDIIDTPNNGIDDAATILAAYPAALAIANEEVDPVTGESLVPWVVRDCNAAGVCAYYQYLQGTSMASPHAAGVAALIVSEYGKRDRAHGGLTLAPAKVEKILLRSAKRTACPNPPTVSYLVDFGDGNPIEIASATCVGTKSDNSFYGSGIVNALRAVEG
jgi:subtilisin family serine protease